MFSDASACLARVGLDKGLEESQALGEKVEVERSALVPRIELHYLASL